MLGLAALGQGGRLAESSQHAGPQGAARYRLEQEFVDAEAYGLKDAPEIRDQRSEIRDQRSEIRDQV
jgi:hypothetical protein